MFRVSVRRIVPLVLALLCAGIAFAQPLPAPRTPQGNLLKNGRFENGLKHWTVVNGSPKDKVVCGGVGTNGSACAFRFVNTAPGETTALKQTVTMPATPSKTFVAIPYAFAFKNITGASCLKVTVKATFVNANKAPNKAVYSVCGGGQPMNWGVEKDGLSESVKEKSIRTVSLTVKHTGIGKWYFDNAEILLNEK